MSQQALDALRDVRVAAPDLAGDALYERILSARFGLDGSDARELVEGARESYAEWPVERELKFSDVVHYLVTVRCLDEQEPEETHRIDGKIGQVVRSIIPEHV